MVTSAILSPEWEIDKCIIYYKRKKYMVVLFHIKIVFHRILELLRMGKHLELVSRKKANLLIDTCLNLGYQTGKLQ